MKKQIILSILFFLVVDHILAQSGMSRFQNNLGSTPSTPGSGVPVDGGISAMVVGSIIYGYKRIKDRFNK
jgi:hypothetical protein